MIKSRLIPGVAAAMVTAIPGITLSLRADETEDIRALIDVGNYTEAVSMANEYIASHPKSGNIGAINALAGEALYLSGESKEAASYLEKARAKGVADAYLFSARIAMRDYDFEQASEYYDRYISLKEKASKPVDSDAPKELREAQKAEEMLERVEDIVVIDRIDVDPEDFFTHYRLSPESGSLLGAETLAPLANTSEGSVELQSPVFQNESGNYRLWSRRAKGEDEFYLVESTRFLDGQWEEPQRLGIPLTGSGDIVTPFMLSDGTTLYFASNDEESIGGYDIFKSNRDSSTGEFLSPVNLGMPYNSPYNDYMLAIDESTGAGWWATDRNTEETDGKISIYVFIPNETRRNYSPENPQLISLARLDDITLTVDEEDEPAAIAVKEKIGALGSLPQPKDKEFEFPISANILYTSFSDFKSAKASSLMKEWLAKETQLDDLQTQLITLRRKYATGSYDSSIRAQILSLEKQVENETKALNRLRGQIIRAELKQ